MFGQLFEIQRFYVIITETAQVVGLAVRAGVACGTGAWDAANCRLTLASSLSRRRMTRVYDRYDGNSTIARSIMAFSSNVSFSRCCRSTARCRRNILTGLLLDFFHLPYNISE